MQQQKKKINLILYCIFFFNGCFYASNQLLVNNITSAFDASESQMALMIGALYAGPMLMVLFFGPFSDRVGRKKSGAIAIFIMFLGALFIASIHHILFITLGFLLYGIGVGGMESVMFALTSDVNGEKAGQHLIFNQALFSIGAMLSPLLLAKILPEDHYQIVYVFIFILCLFACYAVYRMPFDELKQKLGEKEPIGFFHMLKHPYLIFLVLSIIVSTGSESAFTYWSGVFFDSVHASQLGAIALSTYWFASILGRLFSSRIKNVEKLTFYCFAIAAAGTCVLVFMPNAYLKLAGMLIVGAAFAPLYPAIGYQSSRLFPSNTGAAFAIITFSSNLGGMISQPLISGISGKSAISNIYITIGILCGMLAVLTLCISQKINKNKFRRKRKCQQKNIRSKRTSQC